MDFPFISTYNKNIVKQVSRLMRIAAHDGMIEKIK